MEVVLHAPVPKERFSALEGVRVVSEAPGGKHIALAVRGKLGPLLRVLSDMPIDDLTFAPPDLESVFLHYYSDDEESGRASETRPPAEVR